MNLTQLKYFEAVCAKGSFSRAADALHISQPSLSASMKELEAEFGVTLFQRRHKGTSPTPEGEIFRTMCRDILARAEQMETIMKDFGSGRKILKVGLPPMIGSMFLTRIYQDFCSQYPDVTVEIFEGGYQDLKQKLKDGFLDVTFMSHDDTLDPELSSVFLSNLEVVCCVHKENPVAKLPCIKLKDLENKSVVLFEDSFFQTAKIKERFRQEKVEPQILLQTSQLSTLLNVISHNMAVGFMFAPVLGNDPDIVPIPLEKKLCIEIALVYRQSAYPFQSVEHFIDCIRKNNPFGQNTDKKK